MAKRVNTEGLQLSITQDYIDRCISKHIEVLVNLIRSEHAPPADGSIVKVLDAIDALRFRVIASDDKAGRGIGNGDELE